MIALQIADIRHFMKKLLLSESFDRFLLLEGSITTFCTFHMDGQLQKAYYTGEEQEQIDDRSLAYWEEIRPFCFELIKGKRTPLAFRFTFQLSASNTEKLLHQTVDKTLDQAWDGMIQKFLHQQEIPFELM